MNEDLSRRAFVVTSLSAGFALAVRPVSAQTITTDTNGIHAEEVKIGQMPAYHALPTGTGPFPVVVVVHEIFGVHEHIKDLCRRLAKAGYHAVAPELFARQGDVSKLTDFKQIFDIVMKVPDEQVMKDIDATLAFANAAKGAALTGFCWGGRVAWLYAAQPKPQMKCTVAWYGMISNPVNANWKTSALDVAPKLKIPVLGLYGAKDAHIPVAQVELMKKEIKAPSEIVIYPNADHGFNADYRPSYEKQSAQDAWGKMLAFFKKNGVG